MIRNFIILFYLLLPVITYGQHCLYTIKGTIQDATTAEALPFASIYLEENGAGVVADEDGIFVLEKVCPGDIHLLFRHVGCEPERIYLDIGGDTTIVVQLAHHTELIDEVTVHGKSSENTAQNSATISAEEIARQGDTNLGDVLDGLTGVSTLRNGAGISKPVIHGLFGNRISILNNGVAQSGQQWGNDHAPEIDPFVADHLSVLKGVAALAYNGSSLGGVVLVEPGAIEDEPHLHGAINYLYATNGRGHTLNTRLEKASSFVNWRLTATLKYQGDNRSPNYFLANTGRREANLALQLEKRFTPNWKTSLYYSLFTTELGILSSSHIGNLTDLELAIGRDEPFFLRPGFTYELESPRQQVAHHLLKFQSIHSLPQNQQLKFTYALQLNSRQEFDVRRGERSNIAALDLLQFDQLFTADYSRPIGAFTVFKSGAQFQFIDNENQPGTGIMPLIPNYESINTAAYGMLRRERGKWFSELGLRYDFRSIDAIMFSNDVPRVVLNFTPQFHNLSGALGVKYQVNASSRLAANLGLASRSPAVNELYSSGLHQGVSGIEEGDPNLNNELGLKGTLSLDWSPNEHFFLQLLTYYQRINDYIFLEPQPDFRLTIRGAFPLFLYRQTDAELAGLDLLFSIEPSEQLKLVTKYSYLRGTDISNDLPLVFMPPNRLSSSLEFAFPDSKRISNSTLELSGEYTFRQNRLTADQDFLAAPDAYFLLNLKAGTHLQLGGSLFHLSLRVDNVLNTRYRNYLNRLRYFADDLGRNVVVGISWDF